MRILNKIRKQKAVYFAPSGRDQKGKVTYAEPVELRVRWEEKQEEFLTAGGTRISRAIVYTPTLLELTGVLWQGKLSDLVSETNPFANENAWPIQAVSKTPTLNGRKFLCMAVL